MNSAFERSRSRRVLLVLGLMFYLVPVASQAQEASIIGQVTDDTGAVLPGVTVTATSPALQVPQVIAGAPAPSAAQISGYLMPR